MEGRVIKVKGLYLEKLNIEAHYDFDMNISLTYQKRNACIYGLEDVPQILQILKTVFGFENCYAENVENLILKEKNKNK